MNEYSTESISEKLLAEIKDTLKLLDYGSVEIFVVDSEVTQITKRHIKKTNHKLEKGSWQTKKNTIPYFSKGQNNW